MYIDSVQSMLFAYHYTSDIRPVPSVDKRVCDMSNLTVFSDFSTTIPTLTPIIVLYIFYHIRADKIYNYSIFVKVNVIS